MKTEIFKHIQNQDCNVTFRGLQKWYKSNVEKFGWIIVMSFDHPDSLKESSYLESLLRLNCKLNCYYKQTNDQDKKNDIKVMKRNIKKILLAYVQFRKSMHAI
jgi:hypothetical protein